MSGLATSITVLCSSLFTVSLIKALAPKGRTEKILQVVISFFVLICIAVCVKSVAAEFRLNEFDFAEESDKMNAEIDANIIKLTGDYLVQYTESLLVSQEIEPEKIKITVDTDENGVINITQICIYLNKDNASSKHKVTELIEKDFNVTPIIIEE